MRRLVISFILLLSHLCICTTTALDNLAEDRVDTFISTDALEVIKIHDESSALVQPRTEGMFNEMDSAKWTELALSSTSSIASVALIGAAMNEYLTCPTNSSLFDCSSYEDAMDKVGVGLAIWVFAKIIQSVIGITAASKTGMLRPIILIVLTAVYSSFAMLLDRGSFISTKISFALLFLGLLVTEAFDIAFILAEKKIFEAFK